MAFEEINRLTLQYAVEEAMDNVSKENTFLMLVEEGKIKAENTGGGSRVDIPLTVRKHSVTTMLESEDQQVNINTNEVSALATWQFSSGAAPITIGLTAKVRNTGKAALDNIWMVRSKTAVEGMAQDINSHVLGNTSDHSKWQNMLTFNGLTGGNGAGALTAGTGMFASAAFGSQTHSVGGVSTALYPDAWQHQYQTLDASFSTTGLDRISLLIQQCRKACGRYPGVAIFSQSAYQHIRRAIRTDFGPATVAVVDDAKFGYRTLQYDGVPILFDAELENSGGTTTGILSGVFLDLDSLKLYHSPDAYFAVSEEVNGAANGFAGQVALIHTDAALTVSCLKGMGVIVNGDTWA
jgi:hypothetical protein